MPSLPDKVPVPHKPTVVRTIATHVVDDMQTMQLPFFALQEGDMETVHFHDSQQRLTKIIPSSLGRPTVRDKDLLLYVYTIMRDALSRGQQPPQTITISVREFLRWAKRSTSGAAYKHIASMLIRLQYSPITTEIPTGGRIDEHFFSFFSNVTIQRDQSDATLPLGFGDTVITDSPFMPSAEKSAVQQITVTLSPWCYRQLLGHETLVIAPAYLSLRSPIEKRLFEIAWKHLGAKREWRCSLDKLRAKVGYDRELRFFRRDLTAIIARGTLGGQFDFSLPTPTQVLVQKRDS